MEIKSNKLKNKGGIIGSLVIGVALFLGGIYIGTEKGPEVKKITGLVNKETMASEGVDFEPFWKAWQLAQEKFPDSQNVSYQDRVYGAIEGMLASFGDPYTTFLDPKENSSFKEDISGTFVGVGIELAEKDNTLTVVSPLKNTPAYHAGILSGDKILKINDTLTSNISVDESAKMIRGEEGTQVSLTILREGFNTPKVFNITRSKINIPIVNTEIKGDVFVLSLYNFSAQSSKQFKEALNEYLISGKNKLVLDLRGNPGGYVDAAVEIASMFVPEGKVVLKEIGKDKEKAVIHRSRGGTIFPQGHRLIILVDKGTASSGEILAGALSEHGIGMLVGTNTFGKGSVQELVSITKDTSMKVTIAKWYTPNDISISDNGLTPKIIIKNDPEIEGDNQLAETLKLFE